MLLLPFPLRRPPPPHRCSSALNNSSKFVVLVHFLLLLLPIEASGQDEEQQAKNQPQRGRVGEACFEPRDLGVPCSKDGTGSCQPFIYKGCGGSLNRFKTAVECRQTCAKLSGKTQQWVLAERCNASHLVPDGQYIDCVAGKCPDGHKCNPAEGICCPTKDHVCALQDDSGTFAEGVPDKPRFAWSASIKSCWRFSYFGAKGNYNNFPTFHECLNFCETT